MIIELFVKANDMKLLTDGKQVCGYGTAVDLTGKGFHPYKLLVDSNEVVFETDDSLKGIIKIQKKEEVIRKTSEKVVSNKKKETAKSVAKVEQVKASTWRTKNE